MKVGNSRRSGASSCKRCGGFFDAVAELGQEQTTHSEPGSISICIKCGNLGIFTENGQVRQITEEEENEALKQPEILVAIRAVFHLRLMRFIKDAKG